MDDMLKCDVIEFLKKSTLTQKLIPTLKNYILPLAPLALVRGSKEKLIDKFLKQG